MKFLEKERERERESNEVGGFGRKRSPNVFLSVSLIWVFSTCSTFTELRVQGFGGRDASAESINVFLCLFVCPESPKKPWGENEDRRGDGMRVSVV